MFIINDPSDGTTFFITAVSSAVLTTANTIDVAVTYELVTVTVVQDAAIFTVPVGWFIVLFPVDQTAVVVVPNCILPLVLSNEVFR